MKQVVTKGIVLTRTNFGEADRIITMLTPDQGKIRLMAKGVRKIKSKLAGGIELFSVSQITYIPGKKDIHTLVSSRLEKHYGNIVHDINRTMFSYELLKRLNRATEDEADVEYFDLLNSSLTALDAGGNTDLLELWFDAGLLNHAGHQPNLLTDEQGNKLQADQHYGFDFDSMSFVANPNGSFTADHIKFLRLAFSIDSALQLQQVSGVGKVLPACRQLVGTIRTQYIRV